MAYKYTHQGYDEKKMARAVGISLPISYKQAREICCFIKNKSVDDAKKLLSRVLEMKQAVPFKRFNMNVGHKPGNMASGRYPIKAAAEILKLVESAEKNANNKGISNNLYVTHMASHRAPASPRSGRTDGEAKRSHVEIVIEEKKVEKKQYVPKKGVKKIK